ncbi:hypothetical protein D9M73_235300 [compost metagenome]
MTTTLASSLMLVSDRLSSTSCTSPMSAWALSDSTAWKLSSWRARKAARSAAWARYRGAPRRLSSIQARRFSSKGSANTPTSSSPSWTMTNSRLMAWARVMRSNTGAVANRLSLSSTG